VSKVEVAYIETVNTVSIILNGRFRSLSLNTDQGRKAPRRRARKSRRTSTRSPRLADIATYITRHTFGRVTVDDKDRLRLDGKVVDYGLSEIILRLLTEGAEVGHLTKFLENVARIRTPKSRRICIPSSRRAECRSRRTVASTPSRRWTPITARSTAGRKT
jgi:hypothetical protein